MNANPTCDVESCDQPRMLVIERQTEDGAWVHAGFCDRHAYELELWAEVVERLGRISEAVTR